MEQSKVSIILHLNKLENSKVIYKIKKNNTREDLDIAKILMFTKANKAKLKLRLRGSVL